MMKIFLIEFLLILIRSTPYILKLGKFYKKWGISLEIIFGEWYYMDLRLSTVLSQH